MKYHTKVHHREGTTKIYRIRLSEENKENKCDICNQIFGKKKSLKIHKRLHTNEMLFNCELCTQSFSGKKQFKKHKKSNEPTHIPKVKTTICDHCDLNFANQLSFKNHMNIHTKEKRQIFCPNCDKSFKRVDFLNSPITNLQCVKIEEKKKIPKCDICNRIFGRNSSLKVHKRLHVNEQPFDCELCPRSFNEKRNLERHTQSHSVNIKNE